jgi:hypothetical protein
LKGEKIMAFKLNKKDHDILVMNLSEIKSDTTIWKAYGDEFAPKKPWKNEVVNGVLTKKSEHPFDIEGFELNLCIKFDVNLKASKALMINKLVFKHKINLYAVFGKKMRKISEDFILHQVYGSIVTLQIPKDLKVKTHPTKDYEYYYKECKDYKTVEYLTGEQGVHHKAFNKFLANLINAKKMIKYSIADEIIKYQKEASSFDGDFYGNASYEEHTRKLCKQFTRNASKACVLNIVGDVKNIRDKDLEKIRKWCPIIVYNMRVNEVDIIQKYQYLEYTKKHEDDSVNASALRRLFSLGKTIIDKESAIFLLTSLVKACNTYVELGDESSFEYIKNIINIYLKYDDYLDISKRLRLPSVVDFVVGEFIHDRDVEIEPFFEDHKDDDYEEINNKYLED